MWTVALCALVALVGCEGSTPPPTPLTTQPPAPPATQPPPDTQPPAPLATPPPSQGGPYVVDWPKRVPVAKPMRVVGASRDPWFWAQFVGATPGARSAELVAFCGRGGVDVQEQVISPHISFEVERQARSCTLYVGSVAVGDSHLPADPLTRDELAALAALDKVVQSWGLSQKFNRVFVDDKHGVTVSLLREHENGVTHYIALTWAPHTSLESIIGTKGQLLAGFDLRPLLGKPPQALQRALKPPYGWNDCLDVDVSCSAAGPTPPGGTPVHVIQATFRRGETLVSLNLAGRDVAKALALIEASLGKLEPDKKTRRAWLSSLDYRMVRNAGITYFLTIHQDITIHIPHDQPADQMAD